MAAEDLPNVIILGLAFYGAARALDDFLGWLIGRS